MENGELILDVGNVLQLQFLPDESHVRHYVKVIGYLHDKSLIVTIPQVNGKLMLVREGQPIAVRLMSGNNVMAFTVSVLKSRTKPYPYLHLSYPTELQAIKVRKAQRVSFATTAIVRECGPATSTGGTPPDARTVKMEDMSTTGALLISDKPLGIAKDLLVVTMTLNIAEAEEELSIVAVIRNIRDRSVENPSALEYLHGVEFQFADRQESIMLHAFVYEQIVHGHS